MSSAAAAAKAASGGAGAFGAGRRQQGSRFLARRVDRFDGQVIYCEGRALYELGNYLGGGAAGVVYEAIDLRGDAQQEELSSSSSSTSRGLDPAAGLMGPVGVGGGSVAIKILNPVGFRLLPSGALQQRCLVAVKGAPVAGGARGGRLAQENVWWLLHPASKAVVAAYQDPKTGALREIPLPKCIEIWGWDGLGGGTDHFHPRGAQRARQHQQHQQYPYHYQQHYQPPQQQQQQDEFEEEEAQESKVAGGCGDAGLGDWGLEEDDVLEKVARLGREVLVNGVPVFIPRVPAKYLHWVRARRRIYREIQSMQRLGAHPNVVRLQEVLELLQDSKSTLFLCLELVTGGELFERIPLGCGTSEQTARFYTRQLVEGVQYCHARGVCHRDIKPENLLLDEHGNLKVADFGLSTAFAIAAGGGGDVMQSSEAGSGAGVRRLRSVVGSPHYSAPEVTHESVSVHGYDGRKADAWSVGVILYAMLVGTLPFGRELSQCPRFQRFRRWIVATAASSPLPSSSDGSSSPTVAPASRASSSGRSSPAEGADEETAALTPWLFPAHVSPAARALVVQLLHPDPARRLSVAAAARQPWLLAHAHATVDGSAAAATSAAATSGGGSTGSEGTGRASCSPVAPAPSPSAGVAAVAGGGSASASARASPAEGSMNMQAVIMALRSLSEGHERGEQVSHQQQLQLPALFTHGLTVPSPPPPPILEGEDEEEEEGSLFSASPGRPA